MSFCVQVLHLLQDFLFSSIAAGKKLVRKGEKETLELEGKNTLWAYVPL